MDDSVSECVCVRPSTPTDLVLLLLLCPEKVMAVVVVFLFYNHSMNAYTLSDPTQEYHEGRWNESADGNAVLRVSIESVSESVYVCVYV